MNRPALSVVVTIVDGGDTLARFLRALVPQGTETALEIIVPYDATVPETSELVENFPQVRFLALGRLNTERPVRTEAGRHELYDRRRAAGLAGARAELIAILEDRGTPAPDWAATAVRLHRENRHAAIGGAIECASEGLLNWSLWIVDFGRYGLPFAPHAVRWISDINVTYKRRAIDATRSLWQERFHEPLIHGALVEQGESLLLSPELVVHHRRPTRSLWRLLPERFHWGRLFGCGRARSMAGPTRAAYALASPLIVGVLLARHGRGQWRQGRFGRFVRASPLIVLLLVAWTIGEACGYVTARA